MDSSSSSFRTSRRLLLFPSLSHTFFPTSCELSAELKSYNLDLVKILAHLAQILKSCKTRLGEVSFLQDDDPEERPGFGVARFCNIFHQPWKSSRPKSSKVTGLERMIHVVKASTNQSAEAKFGPNLNSLGLNYDIFLTQPPSIMSSGGAALQCVRC